MKNIIQTIINAIAWIFVSLFIITFLFTIFSNLNIVGGYKTLIVQSGSMEPTIMTGDVIVITKTNNYEKNDVITFQDLDNGITTHRIVDINNSYGTNNITTKGDANRTQDSDTITENMIMGEIVWTLPKLGYFINFLRSKIGLVIFLVIPGIAIFIDEIIKLFKLVTSKNNSREIRH